jgi:hypothetical protein
MQNLSFRFTQYMNWRRKKTGHLFQGCFKALLVDADCYLLELIRYLHLNPLRAGMMTDPDGYPWSSHGDYPGRDTTPWLTTNLALGLLDSDAEKARKAYGQFVKDGMGEGHRVDFHTGTFEGRVLGPDDFVEQAMVQTEQHVAATLTLDAVLETVCNAYQVTIQGLSSPGRQQPLPEARAVVNTGF